MLKGQITNLDGGFSGEKWGTITRRPKRKHHQDGGKEGKGFIKKILRDQEAS